MASQESRRLPMQIERHLILAGGGHSHALLLRRWAMQPRHRPQGLITLVSRYSTTLYSGMVPGLVSKKYNRNVLEVDLRELSAKAGVALIIEDIIGIDPIKKQLHLQNRLSLTYDYLSLNVGCITVMPKRKSESIELGIKPLEPALETLLERQNFSSSTSPVRLLGSGLGAIEMAFALRHRWPKCPIELHAYLQFIPRRLQLALVARGITLCHASKTIQSKESPNTGSDHAHVLSLHCTGSQAPKWVADSGLPVDARGRVRTQATLEVIGYSGHFAVGDCAVINDDPRPPSGVWAVRAAKPLARNLEAYSYNQPLRQWRPQSRALQLLGSFQANQRPTAWALWGPWLIGPHPWLWKWKQHIDRQFMASFETATMERSKNDAGSGMLCRGCASKLAADPLKAALDQAGLKTLGSAPEDASPLPDAQNRYGRNILQSVDGFPALISDPWLNGRLTALHACSDLWACGANVDSAQTVVTLPLTNSTIQQELLGQTLAGVRSVFEQQSAQLIGGHTLEARTPSNAPISLDIQVILSVQGSLSGDLWSKTGMKTGDQLLLSRPLGTGVLFAGAMAAATAPRDLDLALAQMATSQHSLVGQLRALERAFPGQLHAATDITGFGLLGHLGEMLGETPRGAERLQVNLDGPSIPSLSGALSLLTAGHASSLAPANRHAWKLLDPQPNRYRSAEVTLNMGSIQEGSKEHRALLELLVDPQTCGPMLISVAPPLAKALVNQNPQSWFFIGHVSSM